MCVLLQNIQYVLDENVSGVVFFLLQEIDK